MSEQVAALLSNAVEGGLNILVSGGTGTGKTTMLNVLSGFVPQDERIVTIEDAVELQLHQDHVVRLEARPSNTEGQGEITIRDLVKNALRMRPDRIIVGEVRGARPWTCSGHEHRSRRLAVDGARQRHDALSHIETMVLMRACLPPGRSGAGSPRVPT